MNEESTNPELALRRKAIRAAVVGAAAAGALALGIGIAPSAAWDEGPAATSDPVRRGEYLVSITGCNDCHTPFKLGPRGPEPDMSRMLSGHPQSLAMPPAPQFGDGPWAWAGAATNTAFAGPWGVSYAPNLTPDDTGLGKWSEESFVAAIRSGKHLGVARPILPPMPWQVYRNMSDSDLKAVYAYLRTVPKVANRVPAPVLAASR